MIVRNQFILLVLLNCVGPAVAVSGETTALSNPTSRTVELAAQLLDSDPSISQLPELSEALASSGAADREHILGLIANRRFRPARVVVANNLAGEPAQTVAALHTLAVLGHGTLDIVNQVTLRLTDQDELVRIAAIDCLATWSDRRFLPLLIERLDDGGRVAQAAERGLMAFTEVSPGHDAANWRAWYDGHFQPLEKLAAVHVEKLCDRDTLTVINAIQALTMFSDLRAEHAEYICPLQEDPNPKVADAAITAMRVLSPDDCLQPKVGTNIAAPFPAAAKPQKPPTIAAVIQKDFFDTWAGLLVMLSGILAIFTVTLYLLRTPKTQRAVRPNLVMSARNLAK